MVLDPSARMGGDSVPELILEFVTDPPIDELPNEAKPNSAKALRALRQQLGKLDSLTRMTMQGELVRLWRERGFTTILVTHDVEEALLLSNRVIIFTERPARVKAELIVDRPYPRHRDDPRLVALRRQALELLGHRADW